MDTQQNDSQKLFHKGNLVKAMTVFVLVLTAFVLMKTVSTIKEFGYIGKGTVATDVITVSGKGEVLATPDIAEFTFTVSEEGTTAKIAQDKATAKSNPALKVVKDAGVEDKDVKTITYDLSPKYESTQIVCVAYPCPQGKQKLVGYTVTQTVDVKVRKIDDAGALIAKITALAVSSISGLNFTVDDQDVLTAQAREKAIADARAKAVVLARDLGVRLGRVVNFSDNSGGPVYYSKAVSPMSAGALEAPAPDLPTGQNTTTSNVSVTYEIN